MTRAMTTAEIRAYDAELTAEGYDMTRSHVALVVDGLVYGVGKDEAHARRDAEQWLAETDRTLAEHSEDEIDFVPITEYQASLEGDVSIHDLIRRH